MAITLAKGDEAADLNGVEALQVGAQWDPSTGNNGRIVGALRKKKGTDIDLIAIAMRGPDPVRLAGLDSLDPFGNGSLTHSGDNQTGAGAGDDEVTQVTFRDVPDMITSIVYTASAFKKGNKFSSARNIEFNVYDATGGRPEKVAQIWPSLLGDHNACAVAVAFRADLRAKLADGSRNPAFEVWKFEVVEEMGKIKQGDDQSLMRFAAKYARS